MYETIPDTDEGTTPGLWLVFVAADDADEEDVREAGAVAEAEHILEEGGGS